MVRKTVDLPLDRGRKYKNFMSIWVILLSGSDEADNLDIVMYKKGDSGVKRNLYIIHIRVNHNK